MKAEVEIKVRVANFAELERRVQAIAHFVEDCNFTDKYFIPRGAAPIKQERFRLRYSTSIALVSFKQNDRIESLSAFPEFRFQVCDETEFTVGDVDAFIQFAQFAGCQLVATLRKERRLYQLDGLNIELNTVADQGDFLEIEAICGSEDSDIQAAQLQIIHLFKQLPLQTESIATQWYTDKI